MARCCGGRAPDGTGTLIWGIVFVVVGGGLLVQRTMDIQVWDYLWRLWPVLLIIMGVKVLADYYGARGAARRGRR